VLQILLAEDNDGDVMLVEQALTEHGIDHELYVVKDGDEALEYVAAMGNGDGPPCPDVLLLDLNLPKVDGPQVLERFRKHPACAQTPVIVVTSSDAPKDRQRVKALGANAYFRKPSDLTEFMALGALVKEVVQQQNVG
jgi:two-component system, chemotaxis family, response regulator Rcp1